MSEDPKSAEGQARRLENVNRQLAALLRRPEVAQRLRAAGPDEWSSVQILGHMVEFIDYWMGSVRALAAATGEPPHFGRSVDAPERLAAVQHGATSDPEALLDELDRAATAAARDIRAMTPAQRARTGIHNRLGEIAVSAAIEELVVGHAEAHLAQAQQVLGTPG
jgi:uncharacterized damage-inducible protein DinB